MKWRLFEFALVVICIHPFLVTILASLTFIFQLPFRDDIEIKDPEEGVVKIVMKFGGSSLATAARITYVSKLVVLYLHRNHNNCIIGS